MLQIGTALQYRPAGRFRVAYKIKASLTNNTDDPKDIMLILAIYDEDGDLLKYESRNTFTAIKGLTVNVDFDADLSEYIESGGTYKVLAWGDSFIPICSFSSGEI